MTDQDKRTGAPSRYVQGPGALRRLGRYTRRLGQGVFLISDAAGIERIRRDVEEGLPGAGGVEFVAFEGACCEKEITELVRRFEASGCQVVAGAGGGRHLDVAKAVAAFAGAPMVMLPTVISRSRRLTAPSRPAMLSTFPSKYRNALSSLLILAMKLRSGAT